MPSRLRLLASAVLAAGLAGGAIGCRRSEPSHPVGTTVAPAGQGGDAAATARSGQAVGDDPADALGRLVADLAAGRADPVYAAVPDRYRQDLDRFLAESVKPTEPETRRRVAEAVTRFADALREKETFVLGSDRFEIAGPAAEVVRSRFGPVCRLVAATARWPGWSEPEAGNAKSLIAAVVSAVAADGDLAADLRSLRFETVSTSGDRAAVRVRRQGEAEGHELATVRVDGVWVPATVAERWQAMFPAAGSAEETGRAPDLAAFAEQLDSVTAALAEVSTQAGFDALAGQAATLLLATAAEAGQAPRAVRPEEFVTVEILGRLTDEQKDRIVWELASRTDAPPSGLADAVDLADGGGVAVTVGPVSDVAAFAKRLTGLKVERVDADKKTVTARYTGP